MSPDGDRDAIQVMAPLDSLKPGFRALVHEYGAIIVLQMIAEGYDKPDELRPVLQGWRERRQEKWLATDYPIKSFA